MTVFGGVVPLGCGDVIEAPVRLREPEVYRDPARFSYADWLLGQGVGALGTAKVGMVRVVRQDRPGLRCRISAVQHWAATRLEDLPRAAPIRDLPGFMRLTPEDAGMLAAMLFGDRTALTAELRAGFERTGTFHLFVVSGLHVALLTRGGVLVVSRCRVPEYPAVALTIALGLGYALLSGFRGAGAASAGDDVSLPDRPGA